MDALAQFYAEHAFWAWIGAGALLLALEVISGTGYLLWPAASAGAVGLLVAVGFRPGAAAELGLFAALTIASSLLTRRFFRPSPMDGPDINDPHSRLAGRHGQVVADFVSGQGRVFVEGKEWAAESQDSALLQGERVEVVSVRDGATLSVRRAH